MIIDKTASKRYAEAVFNIAKERGTVDDLEQQARLLLALRGSAAARKLFQFVESPVHLTRTKEEVLEKVLGDSVSKLLLNLMGMLIRRGRIVNIPYILEHILRLINEERGVIEGTVTTALALDESERTRMTKTLRAKLGEGLHLTYIVDPQVIGGVVVRFKDTLIDQSIAKQLKELTRRLLSIELRREIIA